MNVGGQDVSLLGVSLLGAVVGLVAGMFGVGGGFLLTPLLSVVFAVPLPIAIGTGLCQMVGTATSALLRHQELKQGDTRFDVVMVAGSIVGVAAGSDTVSHLETMGTIAIRGRQQPVVTVAIYAAYVVLLVGCSWLFLRQAKEQDSDAGGGVGPVVIAPLARIRFGPTIDLPAIPLRDVSVLVIAYIGVALGFLSGLLGIGGGVALMPVLIYGFGFPIKQAAGTGILALLVTVVIGTVKHSLAGHVHLPLAAVLLMGSTVFAQFGASLTRKLPSRQLRRVFAILLWVTVAAIVWDTLGPA